MGQWMTYFRKKETESIDFKQLAFEIESANHVVVLTGGGASAESGLPNLRDPGDPLWEKYDPSIYGTIWGFWSQPEKIWELIKHILTEYDPYPNDGHIAIAKLEQMGYVKAVITQNVDNLHNHAGSHNVIEYHGCINKAYCYRCGTEVELTKEIMRDPYFNSSLPPKCSCGGVFKPDCILIGERVTNELCKLANKEVKKCDLILVIGTNASTNSANEILYCAMRQGAKVIEINMKPTALTNRISDKIVIGRSSDLMQTVELLQKNKQLLN